MAMNPRETTDKIRNDYSEYIASILSVKDNELRNLAYDEIKKTEFVKGPYLETTLPFEDGKSLKELADEGLVSYEFSKMGKSVHYEDWKLRIHQENSLRKIITENKNMVVSTGTGSGKTECYLYPIFNELMRQKERGELDDGVRALLIFPMNALANDQQKKLRKLLKNYPDITFGRYTGETVKKLSKETVEQAEKRLHQEYDAIHSLDSDESLRKSIPNEFMCREKMVQNPPHILLTNYAMLEYLLLRPDTAPFFDDSSAKNWRFIVIDEAHTYKGASGTEIAFLLRRLKERIQHNMKDDFRCIATSATLGSEDEKLGLAKFAENLFGEPFGVEDIITTKRKKRTQNAEIQLFSPQIYVNLKKQTQNMDEKKRGQYIYNELINDKRLFLLYDALQNRPKKVDDVANLVFSDIDNKKSRLEALIDLIELSAAARLSENESALLPARYHLFVKSLEGMFVQYMPSKKVFLDRKESVCENGVWHSVFELANCQKCGQEYIVGKTKEHNGVMHLVQSSDMEKPEYYFISNKEQAILAEFDEDDSIEESERISELEKYHFCLSCGRITPDSEKYSTDCCNDENPAKIVVAYHLKYAGKDNESNCCPCCGATKKGLIKRFLTANQPATFAVAKSLYDAIPPRPVAVTPKTETILNDFDIFADDDDDFVLPTEVSDETGRKLLIFSDNRQEAAFFAGSFEKRYNLIMWRRAILQCLKEAENNTLYVDDLIKKVTRYAEKQGLYTFDRERKGEMSLYQKEEMSAHYVMQEFLNPDMQTGLEGLGYIKIEPDIKINDDIEVFGMKGSEFKTFLKFVLDTLRQKGVVSYPDMIHAQNEFFAPRNRNAYFRKKNSARGSSYIYGFIPEDQTTNKRLAIIKKVLLKQGRHEENIDELSRNILDQLYGMMVDSLRKKAVVLATTEGTHGVVYYLNHSKWKFSLITDNCTIYKCKKCGKIFNNSLYDLCPELKCDGSLERISLENIQKTPYYSRIYAETKLIPMVAKEHTAQLSASTAGEYQKDFEEGKINVLSCSTTFEMGVDVGELEATFQRNVPPETSNYIQRAGRAGRRTSSAAFSVTFSRRTSHDMTFFQEPVQIIAGKIRSPILEINNEKIAMRHLNSIVVAWFFKKKPSYFDGNTKKIVESDMREELRSMLEEKPAELLKSIQTVIPQELCEKIGVNDWSFIDYLTGVDGSLSIAIEERNSDLVGLREFKQKIAAGDSEATKNIVSAEKLIKTLESEPSISFLSAKGVLPKYGFPIDSVSLDIIGGEKEESKKIDLSRDLKMAISEFAPPAQIVANCGVWESYAINTIPNKSWPTYIYYECPKCKRIHPPIDGITSVDVDLISLEKRMCTDCGTQMNARKFIIPIFGFSTKMNVKPKMVGENKPTSYYSTQTQFWTSEDLTERQKLEVLSDVLTIKGKKITKEYSPGGKLFVLNQGKNGSGLLVCSSCGYSEDVTKASRKNKHYTKFNKLCTGKMTKVSLGHTFSTDVLRLKLPNYKVNLESLGEDNPKDQLSSVLYAILEGACFAIDISRDDINGCIDTNGDIILFDDTPGGSGFVKKVYFALEDVLRSALNKVSGKCGCTEETSCYGCLRTYSNQYCHDDLSRGLAKKYLNWLINECHEPMLNVTEEPQTFNVEVENLGHRQFFFEEIDTNTYDDSFTVLKRMKEVTEEENVKKGYDKLLDVSSKKNFEHPLTDTPIPIDNEIWPEVFWPKSRVALFSPDQEEQYNNLKNYNWYCYIINDDIDAERVFSNIKDEVI